nr:hypothetical protein Iba_chr04bCG2370 [Ipomoea batatas]GMC83545.1 hypothetical protein Iba_chr04cCG3060 [Ipomoea batatas]GMC85547.1 hypothetical protein Iba_chr04dCG2470 [Ipomoea batatas]GMC87664.1 hypothetical protein Iba_chr04eCG2640 [Ipomoea batatas]
MELFQSRVFGLLKKLKSPHLELLLVQVGEYHQYLVGLIIVHLLKKTQLASLSVILSRAWNILFL